MLETCEQKGGRLEALQRYEILDTPPELSFDRITRLAGRLLGTPISLISLIDEDRQWFKSCVGLEVHETSLEVSFCAHAIADDGLLIVPDATKDPRFCHYPLVLGAPEIRFYAGAPLVSANGVKLGTLCVIDTVPRAGLSEEEQSALADLAALVGDELEHRFKAKELERKEASLERVTQEVLAFAKRLEAVSKAAEGILSAGTEDALQQVVRDACSGVLSFDYFSLGLYDEAAHSLHTLASYDIGVPLAAATVSLQGMPSERVIREKRSLVTDTTTDPASANALVVGTGRRSESTIRTPILAEDRVLGVVSVQSYTPISTASRTQKSWRR